MFHDTIFNNGSVDTNEYKYFILIFIVFYNIYLIGKICCPLKL